MINWKLTVIAGGGAFLLSLLLGLLSEVTGGVLVLRALFSGLFFAVLISGARVALIRLLPGFGDDGIQADAAEDGTEQGAGQEEAFQARQVDIVLGQEDEAVGAEDGPAEEMEEEVEDFDSGDDFVPQELGSSGPSESEEDGRIKSETPVAASVPNSAPAGKVSSRGGIPDIGQFEATFTDGEVDSLGEKKSSPISAEILGGVHDTEEMAKAVHTILQKDQEG